MLILAKSALAITLGFVLSICVGLVVLPMMKKLNVVATIGKGPRGNECESYYIDNKILYFITTGGCGALLSKSVKKAKEIAFFDLGPESIKELQVEGFKMILAIDYYGNSIFRR